METNSKDTIKIVIDDLTGNEIKQLLQAHLDDMYATSPPESVHALDIDKLKASNITFWSAYINHTLVGCIALKELDELHGEVKSMRTSLAARNQGVASHLLSHLLKVAKQRAYQKLSLETGSMDFFTPARTLYEKYGFTPCGPFADYTDDPNSIFMTFQI